MTDDLPFESVFAPVKFRTAFEGTVERLGTAIRLGLLPPGSRLPAERELCARLGISRSTLRQALRALTQSGYLRAVRGRRGGTFVTERVPAVEPPGEAQPASWREVFDNRLCVELGVVTLCAERATEPQLHALDALIDEMAACSEAFPASAPPMSGSTCASPTRPGHRESCPPPPRPKAR